MRHRTLEAFGWSTTAGLTTMMLSFAGNVVLARLVGPVGFGHFAFALAIASSVFFAGAFVSFEAIVQCRTKDEDGLGGTALCLALLLATVLGCISGIVVWVVSPEVPMPERRALCLLGFSMGVTMVGYVIAGLQQRRIHFRATASGMILGSVVSLIVAIGMARRGWGLQSLVGREVVNAIVLTGTLALSSKLPRLRWRRSSLDALRPAGLGMCIARVTDEGFGRVDNIIVGAILGPAALGFYSQAYRLALVGYQSTVGLVRPVLLSVYARLEPERRKHVLAVNVSWMGRFLPLLGLLVWYEGEAVVRILYGDNWLEAARLFALFGPFLAFWAFEANLRSVLMGVGRLDAVVRSRLVVLAIFVPGVAWSASAFGLDAVVWTVTGCMGFLVVYMCVVAFATCNLAGWTLLWPPAAAVAFTLGAAGLIRMPPAVSLHGGLGVGVIEGTLLVVVLYSGALVVLDGTKLRADLKELRAYLGFRGSGVNVTERAGI